MDTLSTRIEAVREEREENGDEETDEDVATLVEAVLDLVPRIARSRLQQHLNDPPSSIVVAGATWP
jgi:hypothetical protein